MPDQEHLILVLARDAEEITRDISVFFAPTRDFIEPGADWPQDLTRAELAALIPYLRAMRKLLRDPGKRNDLPDAPAKPTWAQWKESKRKKIGLAPRTIDLLLETGRTTSKTSGKNGTSAGTIDLCIKNAMDQRKKEGNSDWTMQPRSF